MYDLSPEGAVETWILKLITCVLDACSASGWNSTSTSFPANLSKLATSHCQTKHMIWTRPEHLRPSAFKHPFLSSEHKSAMFAELKGMMVERCLPLLDPKNMRFATAPGSKPVFLNPAERRLFFSLKGSIDTECSVEAMNVKLERLIRSLPASILRGSPTCPIPGVFPDAPSLFKPGPNR